MEVEPQNSVNEEVDEPRMMNQESIPNGITENGIDEESINGHVETKNSEEGTNEGSHKEIDSHKDKDRHTDRDREKDRHREREKERHRDKDRHKSSHKDRDRHREKDKHRDKDRDKDKHRSRDEKDRHKDRSKEDKHKERDKERSDKDQEKKDKDRSEKDRERKDKERSHKHRESDHKERSDKDKNRDKDRKSDHDRHKDKKDEKHRSDRDRKDEKHRSDKEKSHKSSHKDKYRDKERKKEKSDEKAENEIETKIIEKMEVKTELEDSFEEKLNSNNKENGIKEEKMFSDDDVPFHDKIKMKKIKEEDDEDFKPPAKKRKLKESEDEDDVPLIMKKKSEKKKRRAYEDDDYEENFKQPKKSKVIKHEIMTSPTKKKKEKEEEPVWKWWEETKKDDGTKWRFLEHKGPVFADEYDPLPANVKFYYDGEPMKLSEGAEEVAGFYARMLEHDYTTRETFNKNFFKDWRKFMTAEEKEKIVKFSRCNFKDMHRFFVQKNEERKSRTKEEKKVLKLKNEDLVKEYGWCTIDGHKQKIGNFRIEPPGLFRGRGDHPKQGMVKRRTLPRDVIINCSKDAEIPKAPKGHKWKEVRHDPNVTWLCSWTENVQGQVKYVMLNAASKLKGQKDWQKYETARKLHAIIDNIRTRYKDDWKSKEMRVRQRGVAMYFIDKLALRAGNEKDDDTADTVGCCSLRVEHTKLIEHKDGKDYVVVFDFLGKDSIRYYNEVSVEKRVFKNLQLFVENKKPKDDLFDRLNTQILNKYLADIMENLTAKVFRTYNASRTLQEQLSKLTVDDEPVAAQVLTYNRANREVAILCNHQRAVPKTHDQSMANLLQKVEDKKALVKEAEKEAKDLKRSAKHGGSVKEKVVYEKKKKAVERLKEQLHKLEISATDKEENKQISLGTSKLNYLDPRITVAWCKKNDIPVDKVYNKTQRLKFQWAIDMATPEYNFLKIGNEETQFKEEEEGSEEDEQ